MTEQNGPTNPGWQALDPAAGRSTPSGQSYGTPEAPGYVPVPPAGTMPQPPLAPPAPPAAEPSWGQVQPVPTAPPT
ncbi:MAG: OmpA family protein, partial [Candidatus Dormibacteraceae bacterium]